MAEIYPQGMAIPTADVQRLLQQSYGTNAINPDILAQYGQGMQNQAQPPPPPQVERYLGVQPIPGRQEYYNLVQQRFNELADMVGGMDVLAKTKHIETARKAAMEDVANIYGPPPDIEQGFQAQAIPGTNKVVVRGGGFTAPQIIDAVPQGGVAQLKPVYSAQGEVLPGMGVDTEGKVVKYDDPAAARQETYAKSSELASKTEEIVKAVDALLTDPETGKEDLGRVQWASGISGKFAPMFSPSVAGTKQQIGNLEALVSFFARKGLVGQGAGSVSDAEQAMAARAATQLITQGSDEQMIRTLRELRERFAEMNKRYRGEMEAVTSGQGTTGQGSQVPPPPTGYKQITIDL